MPPVGSEAGEASIPHADDDLARIESSCWRWLTAAVGDRDSPLRTPVLATVGADGVDARSVILRAVEPAARVLVCFSDVRAGKVAALAHDPHVVWVFYEPVQRIQLRLRALAQAHHGDDVAERYWERLPPSAHGDYLGMAAPGEPVAGPETTRIAAAASGNPLAQRNFAVIEAQVQGLDVLFLRRQGHRRAGFEYDVDGGLIRALELQP